jgi:hypothetical protein
MNTALARIFHLHNGEAVPCWTWVLTFGLRRSPARTTRNDRIGVQEALREGTSFLHTMPISARDQSDPRPASRGFGADADGHPGRLFLRRTD